MATGEDIRFYEIDPKYIGYLMPYAPHLYANKQPGQNNERKYIGVVLRVNLLLASEVHINCSKLEALLI